MEILAFVLYFVLVMAIGVFFFFKSRKSDSEGEYFLGGRSMGPWVTALSAQASDMSAWLLMGLPGSILAFGLGKAWIGIGLALGTAANWIFVARRLRRFSAAANDSITLPQYLSNRFVTGGKALQIISAVIFLVCFTIYVASSFSAGSKVFTAVFENLDPAAALLIFAAIIVLYTFLGGFKAVCWTDFFQGTLMLIALLAVPIVMLIVKDLDYSKLGAVYSFVQKSDNKTIECVFEQNLFGASWQNIASGLAWGLGYFGMPHILVRFMSIKSSKMVKKSATVAIIWVTIALVAAVAIAVLGRAYIGDELLTAGKQELVFVELARNLFPGFIAGILLAAIIAASMSTADSQMLVASSSFTSDIYKPVFRKKANDQEVVWVGRITILVVAVVAYFIASAAGNGAQAIMDMVENAWGGFGASFGPVVLLSLYWKRLTYKGAVAGIAVGAIVDVSWFLWLSETGVYELLPGFAAGLIACVAVSLIDKKPAPEVEALFDRAVDKTVED